MRGPIVLASDTPNETAEVFLRKLKEELLRQRPSALDAHASAITVRGGAFRLVPSWNLLVPVTSATIRATSNAHEVLVTYDIRFTQLVRVCAALSLALLLYTILAAFEVFGARAQLDALIGLGVAAQFGVWGLLFGMNYITTRFKFRRLLRRIGTYGTPRRESDEAH